MDWKQLTLAYLKNLSSPRKVMASAFIDGEAIILEEYLNKEPLLLRK